MVKFTPTSLNLQHVNYKVFTYPEVIQKLSVSMRLGNWEKEELELELNNIL
ncbi:hypothetical protein [Psychrobacillus glaciei]|uniref:hypothetical protein n=1 Tax=Psychrobacillus glaciei TaxID=2283160 RepID=UPI00178C6EED|nr:hypothetical protein [Psychrobacillus glaciei]